VCQLSELPVATLKSKLLRCPSILQLAHFYSLSMMSVLFTGTMAVDKNENFAPEGSIDPNFPVFARFNLAFPKALWDDV